MATSWEIDPALLLEKEDFSLAALIAAATVAEAEFMAKTSSLRTIDQHRRRRRAKDFPIPARPKDEREIRKLGFDAWLLRLKGDTAAEATLRFAGEFVAFCSSSQKQFAGFVFCAMLLMLNVLHLYIDCWVCLCLLVC